MHDPQNCKPVKGFHTECAEWISFTQISLLFGYSVIDINDVKEILERDDF